MPVQSVKERRRRRIMILSTTVLFHHYRPAWSGGAHGFLRPPTHRTAAPAAAGYRHHYVARPASPSMARSKVGDRFAGPASRRDRLRIARRFIAGRPPTVCRTSPKGTTEPPRAYSAVPAGLSGPNHLSSIPAPKYWGCSQPPQRACFHRAVPARALRVPSLGRRSRVFQPDRIAARHSRF